MLIIKAALQKAFLHINTKMFAAVQPNEKATKGKDGKINMGKYYQRGNLDCKYSLCAHSFMAKNLGDANFKVYDAQARIQQSSMFNILAVQTRIPNISDENIRQFV